MLAEVEERASELPSFRHSFPTFPLSSENGEFVSDLPAEKLAHAFRKLRKVEQCIRQAGDRLARERFELGRWWERIEDEGGGGVWDEMGERRGSGVGEVED